MALSTDQQTRLTNLRTAYDALITGQQVAEVEYAGTRTVYSRADPGSIARLKDTITELETLACAPPHARRRAAVRFRL